MDEYEGLAGKSISNTPRIPVFHSSKKFRFRSLIAIGNPIVDIIAQITEETLKKFGMKFGETVFSDEKKKGLYAELEKDPKVKFLPGGSIQNTLRITSWIINMDSKEKHLYKISMLGAVGNDNYRDKIINAFNLAGVKYILETIPNMQTSRCGVGIYKKERSLLTEIRASNKLSEQFYKENQDQIMEHDALLIEGYFIQENFDIIKDLCNKFKYKRKIVILTLSALFIVQNYYDKILELANYSDIIVGNMDEFLGFVGEKEQKTEILFENISKKLVKKPRLFVVTNGSKGVILAKYDYTRETMDFIMKGFPSPIKQEEIVDTNGAGDSFLGGFLSQYMQGKSFESCCKAGNDVAGVILKNIGCTFPKHIKMKFND